MPHISHMCHSIHAHKWDNYVSVYAWYELNAINNVTSNSDVHTFDIIGIWPEQICLPHYTCPTALLLCSTYRSHITAHTSKKINPQEVATFSYLVIAIYLPTTNMPLKCHIYQLLHVQISDNNISKCASHELTALNNVMRNTGIHTYHTIGTCPEQICLPHHTYMPHCTTTAVYIIYPYITVHTRQNNKLQLHLPCYNHIYAYKKYIPQMPYMCNTLQATVWLGILVYIHSILLIYALEQIYLPHRRYISHCTNTAVYI